MEHFVSVIFPTQDIEADNIAEAMVNNANLPLTEDETEYGVYESDQGRVVIRMAVPREMTDEESDHFAESLTDSLLEMGYESFDIETSVDEAPLRITIDEGVPGYWEVIKNIDTSSSQWRKTKRGAIQTKELKAVQAALNDLGYDTGKPDGWFGKKTARGVMKFQKQKGLTVDGDPGKNTIAAMIEEIKKKYPATDPNTYPDTKNSEGEAAYKVVTGSGQGRRYTVYDADGNELRSGRGPGPSNVPEKEAPKNKKPEPKGIDPLGLMSPFDPQSTNGKSEEEVKVILTNLIKQKRFKDALALLDYDMRISISDQAYNQIKTLAGQSESLEETYDGDGFWEAYGYIGLPDEEIWEAEYQGRKVKLNKPMRGDVKKFKVYVKNPKGNVVKVNFGDPDMKIKKSNPARRRSFRARHNCDNPGPKTKARYWSCRKW